MLSLQPLEDIIVQKMLELKQKIRTVRNIRTVARTLAAVSAAKLSRTRRRAAGLREYAGKMEGILTRQQAYLVNRGVEIGTLTPLLQKRETVQRVGLLVITADRGMCGNYNLAACKLARDLWEQGQKTDQTVVFLIKGRKGERYFQKRDAEILHAEGWHREGVRQQDAERLTTLLLDLYMTGSVDELHVVYTQFFSPVRRITRSKQLLPITLRPAGQEGEATDTWCYEPSFYELIRELIEIYLRVQVHDILLESYASEHGARMITMEEATERAGKTLVECQVRYNRMRRESITLDLLGILFAAQGVAAETPKTGEMA
jgi:F-type H+-transporting ATPase subunit gamma